MDDDRVTSASGLTIPHEQGIVAALGSRPTTLGAQHSYGKATSASVASLNGMGLTFPAVEKKTQKIDPNELGSHFSLLYTIVSNEEFDDPGNTITALIASIYHDTGWIIDYGATDHMTYDRTLFNSTPPPRNIIIIANE